MDILSPIEIKDSTKHERIEFDQKSLGQMTSRELSNVLNEMMSYVNGYEEMTDDEKQVIEKVNVSIEKKILAIGWIIKRIQEAQELIDCENKMYAQKIKDNTDRKRVLQNRIDSRSYFLNELMVNAKKTKVEGANYKVMFQKMPDKLVINEDASHTRYYHLLSMKPTDYTWNKNKIKQWLKSNESDDFTLIPQKSKLKVK